MRDGQPHSEPPLEPPGAVQRSEAATGAGYAHASGWGPPPLAPRYPMSGPIPVDHADPWLRWDPASPYSAPVGEQAPPHTAWPKPGSVPSRGGQPQPGWGQQGWDQTGSGQPGWGQQGWGQPGQTGASQRVWPATEPVPFPELGVPDSAGSNVGDWAKHPQGDRAAGA